MSTAPLSATPRRRSTRSASHSVRMDDDLWNKAKNRAHDEGVALNYVVEMFLSGYSQGLIDLPQVELKFSNEK